MIFDWYWKTIWYWNCFWKWQHFADFHKYTWWFSGFNILKVILKSNSVSINKKNHINIKCLLLNKTFNVNKIFSIKLWRITIKFYPMTMISSYHKSEIQFFRNHIPCPRILKMICRNEWFNPPVYIFQILFYLAPYNNVSIFSHFFHHFYFVDY